MNRFQTFTPYRRKKQSNNCLWNKCPFDNTVSGNKARFKSDSKKNVSDSIIRGSK